MTHHYDNSNNSQNKQDEAFTLLSLCAKGLDKSILHFLLTAKWELSVQELTLLQSKHYHIKQWKGSYLLGRVNDGCILEDATRYVIIWRGCTPSQAYKSEQVTMSYRASPFGNFVLVQPIMRAPYSVSANK